MFGDDAPYLLILDTSYTQIDTVNFYDDTSYRINKDKKPDIESAAMLSENGRKILYALGSFSAKNRMIILKFPMEHVHDEELLDGNALFKKLAQVPEVNIEGLAFAENKMIMANRANMTHRTNQLIVFENISTADLKTSHAYFIDLTFDLKSIAGVSGLHYVKEMDLLLFTASEEQTRSALEDGVIGDSYLGWITGFSKKLNASKIHPDQIIRLGSIDAVFKQQKIESVCVENIKTGELVLNMAADNDDGTSTLFKMQLKL